MWGGEYITYERDVLYEQVWTEPLRDVAKSYGVSDVYLGKICRRLSVPLPGRGYWAKRKAGKSPRRLKLPKVKDEPEKLVVWHRKQETRKRLEVGEESRMRLAGPIVVAQELGEPHKLVARTARRLARAKPSYGTVAGRWLGVLDLTISPTALDRALRIADALLKGMEAAGLQVEIIGPAEPDKDDWGRNRNEHLDRVTRVLCNARARGRTSPVGRGV